MIYIPVTPAGSKRSGNNLKPF